MSAEEHKLTMVAYSKEGVDFFVAANQFFNGDNVVIQENTIDKGIEYLKHLIKFNIENDSSIAYDEKKVEKSKVDDALDMIKDNLKKSGRIL